MCWLVVVCVLVNGVLLSIHVYPHRSGWRVGGVSVLRTHSLVWKNRKVLRHQGAGVNNFGREGGMASLDA